MCYHIVTAKATPLTERMVFMKELFTIFLIAMPITIPLMVIGIIKLSDNKKNNINYTKNPYYNPPYDYNNPAYQNWCGLNNSGVFGNTPTPRPSSDDNRITALECESPAPSKAAPPEKPKKTKTDLPVSNILFLIGTIFVVLSGLAFGVASWVNTSHTGRVLIITAAAIIAYALSGVISKFLKLSGTSASFYVLGTGFVSTALLTVGYYKIMGEWFSFDGDGVFALLAVSSFLAAALMLIGAKFFKNISLIYTALSSTALGLLFTILQLAETYEYRSLLFITAQIVIIGILYLVKPFKSSKYEIPVMRVGIITAAIFASETLSYTIYTLSAPTFAGYIIVILTIIQLTFFSIRKKLNALNIIEAVLSLMLSFMIYSSLLDTYSDNTCMIATSLITVIIYLIHRFVPNVKNAFSELITLCAVLFMTFLCIAMIRSYRLVPNLFIAAISSIIVNSYLFHKDNTIKIFAGITSPVIPSSAIISISNHHVVNNDYYINSITCMSILAAILISFSAILLLTSFGKKLNSNAAIYSNLTAAGFVLLSTPQYKLLTLITAALCIIHFALSNKTIFNITALLSSFTFIKIASIMTKEYSDNNILICEVIMFIIVIVYVFLSRVIYHEAIIYNKDSKKTIDPLITVAWMPVLKIFDYTNTSVFLCLIAAAIFFTGLIKKNFTPKTVAILLTVSTSLTVIALIDRPFLIFESKSVTNKITLGIIAVSGIAVRFIWRKFEATAKNFSQIIFIFTFVSLLIDAISFDTSANTIFVMSIMIVVLIISIISRSKTWFITSAASLFTITLFATRDYLMALNWWIYLFLAGVILIGLAAVNEYLKKNNETLKTSVAKKFSGWTW